MNPITNSEVKERFRLRNEADARNTENAIRQNLNYNLSQLQYQSCFGDKLKSFAGNHIILTLIAIVVTWGAALVIGLIVFFVSRSSTKNYNNEIDNKKRTLQQQAENDIRRAYDEADRQTQREIAAYDAEVKSYSQKILRSPESISPMVEHATNMFQRMISHADSGAHIRFIESDFTYLVRNTGIVYSYQSNYTNPQDDYNFNKERYRDLKSDSECEGLAQALAKLIIAKMKALYPANSINITVSHMDARVTMHFKGANKNFVPARDIL